MYDMSMVYGRMNLLLHNFKKVEALSGFDAQNRNTNQRNRELTRIRPVEKLGQICIGKSSEIREGNGMREISSNIICYVYGKGLHKHQLTGELI